MKLIEELALVARARQLRHTFVQGADEKYYKLLTFKLYNMPVSGEFATHETNVEEVNARGGRTVLIQPLIKRFFREDEAIAFHQELLERFDETLRLRPPEKKEHQAPAKPEAKATEPGKPAKKAEGTAEPDKDGKPPPSGEGQKALPEKPPANAGPQKPAPATEAKPAEKAPPKEDGPKGQFVGKDAGAGTAPADQGAPEVKKGGGAGEQIPSPAVERDGAKEGPAAAGGATPKADPKPQDPESAGTAKEPAE